MAASPIEFFSNVDKNTWVHRLDPRVKVVSVLLLATMPLLFSDPWFLGAWMIFFFFLWFNARIDIRPIAPLFLGGLVMVFVYVMYGTFLAYDPSILALAKVKIHIGPFLATDIGFFNGLILGWRLLILLMPVVLVIATTEPSHIAKAFMKMGLPVAISFVILAALRFLPLVFEVASRVMEAQRVRGLEYKGLRARIKNLQFLIVPLFINTLRTSRTLGLAVESKGFGARRWKEFYRDFNMQTIDWAVLAGLVVVVAASLYVRYGLGLGWVPYYNP